MPDLRSWLADLNLDSYYETFVEHRIDSDVLPDLTEADLEKLDIPLGDRKRMMRAIGALSEIRAGVAPTAKASSQVNKCKQGEADSSPGTGEQLRHLTMMFVDLVDSTSLSERLDIEEYREAISRYENCCVKVIQEQHGFVAQYLGDGVLAYFGYPRAAEHDTERAVVAGLEICRRVGEIEIDEGLRLQARVGIATGKVLISDRLEIRDSVLGDTPNLAARLQALANPGGIVISDPTQRLLGRNFECEEIGNLQLKGFSTAVKVWQVRGVRTAESRFHSRLMGPMTPFTGRDEELSILQRRWRAVMRGEGRTVLIGGEAGIGKSRLVETLLESLETEPHFRVRYQCSPYHNRSAFYPVTAQIAHTAGIEREDANQEKLDKLEAVLGQAVSNVEEVAPLFAHLLAIPDQGRYRPLDAPSEVIRERTKEAILDQHFGRASIKPFIVIFEDIHWIDPSTEELLGALIERISEQRVLVLCTYRPEYYPPWTGHAGVVTISLNRLDRRQTLEMIRHISAAADLADETAEAIAGRTEGVPLFIEELTRAVLDTDNSGLGAAHTPRQTDLALPATLNELLMAKLDSLTGTSEVVQICAALGRTFTFRVLAMVSGRDPDSLRTALDRLTRAQILVQRGEPPDVFLSFRHALIQEVAYSTMLKSHARALHARIAAALEAQMPDYTARSPEILAHHYGCAAMPRESRDYWAKAGSLAIDRSDYLEAIAHLEAALAENEKLSDEGDRVATEIQLREKLVIPLEARFWGSDDIAANLKRLQELQRAHGGDWDLFAVLHGLYGTHLISAKADQALDYALQMREIAERLGDASLRLMSEHNMAMSKFAMGAFDEAIAHYRASLELQPEASAETIRNYYLADMQVVDECMMAWASVLKGDEAAAREAVDRAIEVTEATDQEFSQAYAFSILASVHQAISDAPATREFAARAHALCRRQRFRYFQAWSRILHGWAVAASQDPAKGVEEVSAGIDRYIATGSRQIVAYAKTLLADAYRHAGRKNSAFALLEEIEAEQEESSVGFHLPITRRVAAALSETRAGKNDAGKDDAGA